MRKLGAILLALMMIVVTVCVLAEEGAQTDPAPDAGEVASENTGGTEEPAGEPTAEGEGEPAGEPAAESEGEPAGEPAAEGEGEPEGEPAAEGEGEPAGEPAAEGEGEPEGEPAAEGEDEPEGEPAAEGEDEPAGEPAAEGENTPEEKPADESEQKTEDKPADKNTGAPGNSKNNGSKKDKDSVKPGGWKAAADPAVTEELQALFAKGMERLVGVEYTPVVFLGTWGEAGYAFLCQAAVVAPDTEPEWSIVFLYEDGNGKVILWDISDLDLAMFCDFTGN